MNELVEIRAPHRRRRLFAAAFACLAIPALFATWTDSAGTAQGQGQVNRYIGAAKCKNCHQGKECGDQYATWEKQKHANAFHVLASDEAKKLGKEKGIEDPQKSDKCLECHVTAFGKPKEELHKSFDPKLGVQCESCHGPGEKHLKARMAAAATQGAEKPAYTAIPDDEVVKDPGPKHCLGCHNDRSPSFKPFCFHERIAEIRHLNPKKPRTEAEKAALTACSCEDGCVCKKDGKCTAPPKAPDKK